jgi:phosphoglycerol transferase MdoB-like AlkP superfamily enzyme
MGGNPATQTIPQNLYLALPKLIQIAPILIVSFILFIIAFYLAPIAVLNYIKTKKFSEAFNFSKVTKRALTGDYFVNWLIVMIITAVVTLILSVIPWFGSRIAFFITGVIGYSIYGQLLRKE